MGLPVCRACPNFTGVMSHRKSYLATLLLCGWFFQSIAFTLPDTVAAYPEIGNPLVSDQSPKLFGVSPQNWLVWQSPQKLMYVSNSSSLLEYDGAQWRAVDVHQQRVVSLDGDPASTLYVAMDYDFGCLKRDTIGRLVYQSILKSLAPEYQKDLRVRSCFAVKTGVYFISKYYIFFQGANGHVEIQKAKTQIDRAFKVGDNVYTLQKTIGLVRLLPTDQAQVPASDFLGYEGLIGIFKQPDGSLLMCTNAGKFYRYHGGRFALSFSIPSNLEINYRCYQPVAQLPDGRYAFATRSEGIHICAKDGSYISTIGKTSGLRDNLVNALYVDQAGSLWAALDNGVDRIEVSSPFTFFLDSHTGPGSGILSMARHNGALYFGTMTGLYKQHLNTRPFQASLVQDLNFETWDLNSDGRLLLVATTFGVYQIADTGPPLLVTRRDHLCRSLVRSMKHKDIFYASTSTGIMVLQKTARRWRIVKEIDFSGSYVDYMKEDQKGSIWASAYNDGYYRIDPGASGTGPAFSVTPVVTKYDQSHGLQLMRRNKIFEANGTVLFSSDKKLLQFDSSSNRFVGQKIILRGASDMVAHVTRLIGDDRGNLYVVLLSPAGSSVAMADRNGNLVIDPAFSRLGGISVYAVMPDRDSVVWLGTPSAAIRVDLRLLKKNGVMPAFTTMIRKVVLNKDSVLYIGRGEGAHHIRLPYGQKSMLRFEFAAPSFDNPAETQFQYFLEGYGDDWSDLTSEAWKDYTNLREGHYRFHVRAKDIYGVIGKEDVVDITIWPPWYRAWWAYLFYGLLVLFSVWLIIQWRLRQLSQEKSMLEHKVTDRTRELAEKNAQLKEQAEKLEELDALKSRFFANISHEFRTPLTLILGPLEQFFNSAGKDKPGETALTTMYRNGKRLHQLIDQLLYVTRLESGHNILAIAHADIHRFIRSMLLGFDTLAHQKKIACNFAIPALPAFVFFDADKLEKILYNLLSNAFKFTPEGGTITITLAYSQDGQVFAPAPQDVETMLAAQWMRITVEDSGTGISEDNLSRIFDRFYQVQVQGSAKNHGIGIGLSIVKELLKIYGGFITATSKPGEGTCFTVTLPVAPLCMPAHEMTDAPILSRVVAYSDLLEVDEEGYGPDDGEPEAEKGDAGTLILIVEDNVEMAHYIRDSLKDQYDCVIAKDGKEGTDKAVELIPDLIVTDVMMPETDGLAFCHNIKADVRTSHIPVIMLTAKADQASKIEGLKTGADDYLSKPFDRQELRLKIHNLIASRVLMRERYSKEVRIEPSAVTATSMDETFLKKAISIVEENLVNPGFGVELFVTNVGVSRTQLHRKLKALTGQSAGDFIRAIRLKRAAQLLEKNSDTVTQIAYQVGFNDQSYFTKSFRRQFGVSPSAYAAQRPQ